MVKRSYKYILLSTLILGTSFGANNVFATDPEVNFSVTINPSLSLSVSSNTVNLPITPDVDGEYNSAYFTITSATNNTYGYTLTMSTEDNHTYLESTTVDPTTGAKPQIQSLASSQNGITTATFEAATTEANGLNRWGIAIGSGNYNAVTSPKQVKKTTTNNASGADNTTVNIAAKLNLAVPAGTYKNKFIIQMVVNPAPVSLEQAYQNAGKTKATIGGKQYYAMQDMNSTICSNVTVEDDQLQVYDTRDDKIYWIAKLKDGHCWMTQNLDLDLETTPNHVLALTSENTDLNTFGSNGYDTSNGYSQEDGVITWEPERNTIPTSSIYSTGTISGWTNDSNNPYSVDTGDWYWIGNWKNNGTDTWYSSTNNNYLDTDGSGAGDKFSTSEYTGNGKHGHVGNYYNWSATIASNKTLNYYKTSTYEDITGNPQNSICPAGWRLPTISNASDTDGSTNEFRRLVTLYGTTGNDKALTASPLWFVRGGYADSNRLYDSGMGGYYWSSTVRGSGLAYDMLFVSSGVSPARNDSRTYGVSVRCVAR